MAEAFVAHSRHWSGGQWGKVFWRAPWPDRMSGGIHNSGHGHGVDMIIGIGVDIAELARIGNSYSRFGEKFGAKILTPAELALVPANAIPFLASRFAAKEAAVKALGTGFREGITFQDIEIRSDRLGKPLIFFHNHAQIRCRALGIRTAHLTLSHSRENAVAMVILEG
jgi:holo-[acyl-carrier protein] synthase